MINQPLETVRIDKWVWAVRIIKTRQLAGNLCKSGKILVDGERVKASRSIKAGQVVSIKKEGIEYIFKVLKCIEKRVSAPLASECKKELTPKENLEKLKTLRSSYPPIRLKGMGRPTKKERRNLEKQRGINE